MAAATATAGGGFRLGQRVHAAVNPAARGPCATSAPSTATPANGWASTGTAAPAAATMARSPAAATSPPRANAPRRSRALPRSAPGSRSPTRSASGTASMTSPRRKKMKCTNKKHVSVELVGTNKVRDKLKNFDELMCASVSFMGVSSTGSPEELQGLVPNLRQLDLTGNLLSQWQDISSLCQALPSLEVLDLTNNTMENDILESPLLKNIRVLVLNNCGVTWELVEKIKVPFACLNEVHLIWNKMNIITSPVGQFVQGFNTHRLLNLEDNHIDSWDEIVKLSYLTSLEQLHLNKNKIKHVTYPSNLPSPGPHVDAEFPPFEKLQVLLLGSNEIDDFPSVDSLNLFPSLMDI